MSHYVKCKTKIKDEAVLVTALGKLGVPKEAIDVAEPGKRLDYKGYGSQAGTANVVVRKDKFHKGYGDVAFCKGEDGFYSCTVDDMDDVGSLAKMVEVASFSSSVSQWYSALKARKALMKQGLSAKISRNGGKLVVLAKG